MNFEEYLIENLRFTKNPAPFYSEPVRNQFGTTTHHIKNMHKKDKPGAGWFHDEKEARDHADGLNKAHREKYNITHS